MDLADPGNRQIHLIGHSVRRIMMKNQLLREFEEVWRVG